MMHRKHSPGCRCCHEADPCVLFHDDFSRPFIGPEWQQVNGPPLWSVQHVRAGAEKYIRATQPATTSVQRLQSTITMTTQPQPRIAVRARSDTPGALLAFGEHNCPTLLQWGTSATGWIIPTAQGGIFPNFMSLTPMGKPRQVPLPLGQWSDIEYCFSPRNGGLPVGNGGAAIAQALSVNGREFRWTSPLFTVPIHGWGFCHRAPVTIPSSGGGITVERVTPLPMTPAGHVDLDDFEARSVLHGCPLCDNADWIDPFPSTAELPFKVTGGMATFDGVATWNLPGFQNNWWSTPEFETAFRCNNEILAPQGWHWRFRPSAPTVMHLQCNHRAPSAFTTMEVNIYYDLFRLIEAPRSLPITFGESDIVWATMQRVGQGHCADLFNENFGDIEVTIGGGNGPDPDPPDPDPPIDPPIPP